MFDIGLQELVVIFVIALLVFGPKNLPQLGRSLGRALREFRRASDEFRSTIETNLHINDPDPVPAAPEPAVAQETPPPGGSAPDPLAEPPQETAAVAEGEPATMTAASGEPFLAQRGARLFHSRQCGWVARIPEADRAYFKKVAEAREAGHLPCPACEPWEPV
jgi:sec-independent protein translocase protein TatA